MTVNAPLELTPSAREGDKDRAVPRLSSQDILRGARQIKIEHEGTEYTLHLTRQTKLLLTK